MRKHPRCTIGGDSCAAGLHTRTQMCAVSPLPTYEFINWRNRTKTYGLGFRPGPRFYPPVAIFSLLYHHVWRMSTKQGLDSFPLFIAVPQLKSVTLQSQGGKGTLPTEWGAAGRSFWLPVLERLVGLKLCSHATRQNVFLIFIVPLLTGIWTETHREKHILRQNPHCTSTHSSLTPEFHKRRLHYPTRHPRMRASCSPPFPSLAFRKMLVVTPTSLTPGLSKELQSTSWKHALVSV